MSSLLSRHLLQEEGKVSDNASKDIPTVMMMRLPTIEDDRRWLWIVITAHQEKRRKGKGKKRKQSTHEIGHVC